MRIPNISLLLFCLGLGMAFACNQPSLPEIERAAYALAQQRGVSPETLFLRMLRRARNRQKIDKEKMKNVLKALEMKDLFKGMLQENVPRHQEGSNPPSHPPVIRLPPIGRTDSESPRKMMPQSIFFPMQSLGPPPSLTVRVEGLPQGPLSAASVTFAPSMTLVEVLRQAEHHFRSVLDSPTTTLSDDVIRFGQSSMRENCFIIQSLGEFRWNPRGAKWKIVVTDRLGKVIYDSPCLFNGEDLAIKPGMTITLLYTPF